MAADNHDIKISPSGLMDLQAAAVYLGVSEGTIYWLKRTKKIPCVELGRKLHVRRCDVDAYIEAEFEGLAE